MDTEDILGNFASQMANSSKDDTNLEDIVNNGLTETNQSLEELFERLSESLTEEMKKIIEILSGKSEEGKDTKESAADAMGLDLEALGGNKEDSKGEESITPPNTGYTKVDDLGKIDQSFALSGLLVYYKLDDFQKAIMPFLQKIGAGGGGGKKDAGADVGASIGSPESLMGVAKALKVFASAALLLALVPKKAAEAGIELFIYVIDAVNEMASETDVKEMKDFVDAVSEMTNAIKQFAVACIVVTLCTPFILLAIPGLFLMKIFVKLTAETAELVGENTANYLVMCIGLGILALGFILMGVAFIVMAATLKYIPKALLGIGASILVMTATALLGLLIASVLPIVIIFPIAALTISLGYIFLFAAIFILSNFNPDWEKIKLAIEGIREFLVQTASLLASIIMALPVAIILTLVGVLLLVAFTTLMLSLLIFAFIGFFIGDGEWIGQVITSLKEKLFTPLGDAEFIGVLALSLISSVLLTLAGVLLLAAFLSLSLALLFLALIGFTLTKIDIEATFEGIRKIIEQVNSVALIALLGVVACIPLTLFGALFAVAMLSMLLGVAAVFLISKLLDKIDKPETIGPKLSKLTINILLGLMGLEPDGSLSAGDLIKGGLNVIGMTVAAILLIPFAVASALVFASFALVAVSLVALKENLDKISPEDIEMIMNSMGSILNVLAESAEAFGDTSAETIEAIGSLVKDVAEAMDTLTDVVLKLKDGIPEEQIDAATMAIKMIAEKLFGNPDEPPKEGEYTLVKLFTTLASSSIKELKEDAVAALNPIIDALGKLADLVIRLATDENFSQENVEEGSQAIQRVADLMAGVAITLHPLVKGTGFLGLASSPLEALQEINESDFFGIVKGLVDKFDEVSQRALEIDVTGMQTFVDFFSQNFNPLVKGSSLFMVGMTSLGLAMKAVSNNDLAKMQTMMNMLTVDPSGLTQTVASLTIFASNAPKFTIIANAFAKMASSMKTMSSKVGALSGFFDKIAKKSESIDDTANQVAAENGASIDPNVQLIYQLINDWNSNGVPIRATMDKETGKIEPDNVNNDTGKNGSRM